MLRVARSFPPSEQTLSSGVVSLRLAEGDAAAGPFEVTVSEGSGKRRAVTVSGLDF